MAQALVNGRVLTPQGFRDDLTVVVEGERIAAVTPDGVPPAGAERVDLGGRTLVPGFIDVQVNGGGGVLFNDEPTVEGIAAIGETHRRFGTTGFLPTLISDDLQAIEVALDAADAAIAAGVPGVLGIHVEGPFLNVDRKGIHDPAKFRVLDEAALALLTRPRRGVVLVTLAPETTTPAMIGRLAQAGVLVSAGHTNADYAQTRAALDAGLRGFTHLFNAMSPMTSRAPGATGAALEDTHSWCGLILDGRHVDPIMLRLALRCRPLNRFMLVTDAMPSVGLLDKRFLLQGRPIEVVNGVCVDADGTLAGADLDMAACVRNAVDMLDLDLEDAARMASTWPAAFLRLDAECGSIREGCRAELALLDERLHVTTTWIRGRRSEP